MLDYRIPELRTEPDDEFYVTARCGCEVYEGEKIYSFNGKTMCENCLEQELNHLNIWEIAEAFGFSYEKIEKPERWHKSGYFI